MHRLDPQRRVAGSGEGHVWEETIADIEVEVALPAHARKSNLVVEIGTTSVSVRCDERQLWGGTLHGRVVPSDSSWAIVEPDPLARIKGRRLLLSLKKAHSASDIWATVLDRDFITRQSEGK